MLKLITWPTSPFGAKVKLALCALNLLDRVEIEHYHPWQKGDTFRGLNPLKKIPVLIQENGFALYDSPVICDYINGLRDQKTPTLFPKEKYYDILTVQALCDGILDSGVSVRYETHFRPHPLQSKDWIRRQMMAIESGGQCLNQKIHDKKGVLSLGESGLSLAHLCLIVTLSYLDVRYPEFRARNTWASLGEWKEKMLKDYPHFESHLPRDYLPLPQDLEGLSQ